MPSYKTPTNEQIETVIHRMRSPEFEAYFFARLENPLWIGPLDDRGFFTPPEAMTTQDGRTSYPAWPAGRYLARMAAEAPFEVARVLQRIETTNAFVMGDIIAATGAMPATAAALVIPSIITAAKNGAVYFHLEEAAQLCVSLLEGDEIGAGMALADGLFDPTRPRDSQNDTHWQKEGLATVLPMLVRKGLDSALEMICGWLERAVEMKEGVNRDAGEDYSWIWRQAIEEHGQNSDFEYEGNLVGLVREGFEIAIGEGLLSLHEALGVLARKRYIVFRRLRVHLINRYAELDPVLARQVMMDRGLFDDSRYKHEYAMIIGARFNLLEEDERETWLGWVRSGPDPEELEGLSGEERDAVAGTWRFHRLHWAREHLEHEERLVYEQLGETRETDLADLHMWSGPVTWGTESPMTVDEMKARPFEETLEAVASWRPRKGRFIGPGVERLGTEFGAYVATDPEGFSTKAAALAGRPALFVREFLKRISDAMKEGRKIDVGAVIGLAEWVVSRPREESTTHRESDDVMVDRSWQWTRDQISDLVEVICRARDDERPMYPPDPALRDRVWKLIESLYRDPSRSYISSDNDPDDPRLKDFLTAAINSARGKAVEAGLHYARWIANHIKVNADDGEEVVPGGFDAIPEVRAMLEWQIAPGNRSFEALAVIGLQVGLLFWIDDEWLEANVNALFDLEGIEATPKRAEAWAAWNTFLVWVRPHGTYFKLFERQYEYALTQSTEGTEQHVTREDPMGHLGEHLILLYGWGKLQLDDEGIIRRLLDSAGRRVRCYTMGFVGRILWGKEELPEEMVTRFMELWDVYWAGRGPQDARDGGREWLFGPWFASPQLPPEWALSRLRAYVEADPVPDPELAVAKRLAEIAPTDVQVAVEILDRMIHGDREGWHIHMWREPITDVLRLAIEAGGKARGQALSTIDYLGRRGFPDLGEALLGAR